MTRKQYKRALKYQSKRLVELLAKSDSGTDELSALLKCQIDGVLFCEVEATGPIFQKWIKFDYWHNDELRSGTCYLTPYATSMDAVIPNENIVLLRRKGGAWHARQKCEKRVVEARDRNLACRLAALRSGVWKEKLQKNKKPGISTAPPVDDAVE